jgi:hypothetical protein
VKKPLKLGQRVTVVRSTIWRGRVIAIQANGTIEASNDGHSLGFRTFVLADEGIDWARGWRGAAINALHATRALADTAPREPDLIDLVTRWGKSFSALPSVQKLGIIAGATVAAEMLLTALDKPTSARKT